MPLFSCWEICNIRLHKSVTPCYTLGMTKKIDPQVSTEEWLDDLRDNTAQIEKDTFDRNWLMFAAKYHGHRTVVDIAQAAGLSRMQAHRILTLMEGEARAAVELGIVRNRAEAIERAWKCSTRDQFFEVPADDPLFEQYPEIPEDN